jgi:hypothetical protein
MKRITQQRCIKKNRRIKMKYDKEERDILEALKKGKMKLATPSKKEIESGK